MSTVSPNQVAAVRARLSPDERIAWIQGPEPEAFPTPQRRKGIWDAVVILGGGYATLASIWVALRSGAYYWLGLPILLILIGVAVYFRLQALENDRLRGLLGTIYVVTTRRALIIRMFPTETIEQLDIDAIAGLALGNQREDFADLKLIAKPEGRDLVFAGITESKRAQAHVLHVVRDPKAADAELAHSEAYLRAMRNLARPAS